MDLNKIAKELNEILEEKRKELQLTFTEEGHEYSMLDEKGVLRNNYPSVSTVEKLFYIEFDEKQKALDMCCGDVEEQKKLLEQWVLSGKYASDKGLTNC